ncbi:unnamed protein product, partial [Ascophyllum nodosum]
GERERGGLVCPLRRDLTGGVNRNCLMISFCASVAVHVCMLCAFLVLLCRVLPYLCRATLDYSIIDSSVVVGWKAQASVGCYLYFTATSRPFFLMLDSATDGQNF